MRQKPTEFLYGIHPVQEAFRAGRRKIVRVFTHHAYRSGRIADLLTRVKQAGVSIQSIPAADMVALAQTDRHQGICAEVERYPLVSLAGLYSPKPEPSVRRRLLLLDSIVDPQNLGALIRTACCAAVDGIIITKDRAAAPTPTVSKASAGALEHVRLARVTNMTSTIKQLQKKGFWVFGLSGDAAQSIYQGDFSGSVALVIGSEAKGLRPLVKKSCDQLLFIPQTDTIDSLNASVAGGVAIYEIYRQQMANVRYVVKPIARLPRSQQRILIMPTDKKIRINPDGSLSVPAHPTIPYIEGDGIGPDIWQATSKVIDQAVTIAFGGQRKIDWREVYAGEKGYQKTGQWLPEKTLDLIQDHHVAIKGPLTTPVGEGIRSVNVAIRQQLDLYACVRPVRYIDPVPSPMKHPENIDMVVFRENTEDLYAGIEWAAGDAETERVASFLVNEMQVALPEKAGIGIKPISAKNTKRLVARAIAYALENGLTSVTLMHKGNIMKFTEGAFRQWGYEVAKERFAERTLTETELYDAFDGHVPAGKVVIKDRIADMLFQQVLLRPDEFQVIATPNLNGDYISDALAAQVGGLGMAPGANISDTCAVFEATHGTAPKYAGLDKVNPSSLILSGAMMLDHIGWQKAATVVRDALQATIRAGTVTYDLARQIAGAKEVKCSEFAAKMIDAMQ